MVFSIGWGDFQSSWRKPLAQHNSKRHWIWVELWDILELIWKHLNMTLKECQWFFILRIKCKIPVFHIKIEMTPWNKMRKPLCHTFSNIIIWCRYTYLMTSIEIFLFCPWANLWPKAWTYSHFCCISPSRMNLIKMPRMMPLQNYFFYLHWR